MKPRISLSIALSTALTFASIPAALAECQSAAIKPLLSNVANLVDKERHLLRGAAENTSDMKTHDAYLRQWGYQAGGSHTAAEPKGTRTDLNDALAGLRAYLESCAR